jgi:hypothetical protein
MKPVVSSLVALAIAIAPLSAMAARAEKSATHHGKAATTKVVKHKDAKAEKAEKIEKPIAKVKHSGKKPTLHHASNVDVAGAGHHEPKIEKNVSVVPASLMSKTADHAKHDKKDKIQKVSHVSPASAPKANEMPKLPDPKAASPVINGKNAHEKGARKGAEKKSAPAREDSASNDGESQRDEELAELVARIRRGEPSSDKKGKQGAVSKDSKPCLKDPVEIIRGPEIQKMELMTCEGAPAPLAVENLSILIRPGSAARPTTPVAELAKKKGSDLAPGIRRVDTRLVERVQAVIDHFGKKGPTKLSIISGYRPTSVGSMHSSGRAIDFRMEGVRNEDVVAFCKTLGDTGCGFYPNSSFVHIDVRDPGAGHVAWIDASGPGESPRYVSQWPPAHKDADAGAKADDVIKKPSNVLEHTSATRTEPAAESEPVDAHPAMPDEPAKDSAKDAEE